MNKAELKKRAEDFFKLYPNKKILFGTTDGNFFLDKSPAQNHSRSAKIECFEFSRDEESEPVNTKVDDLSIVEDLIKKMLELDPDTADYQEMKKILLGLDMQPESWKKVDVITSIKTLQVEFAKLKTATVEAEKAEDEKVEDVENLTK